MDGVCISTGLLAEAWRVYCGYWFLHAYVFVALLSPAIDAIFSRERSFDNDRLARGVVFPAIILSFIWSYLPDVPLARHLRWPTTIGLTAFSGVTLLGVYIVARAARYFSIYEGLRTRWLILITIVAILGVSVGLGEYNSPIALLMAVCAWGWFEKVSLPQWLCRWIAIVSPSAFAVYLIQDPVWWKLSAIGRKLTDGLFDCALFGVVSLSIGILVCGLISDVPRRLIAAVSGTWVKPVLRKIDRVLGFGRSGNVE